MIRRAVRFVLTSALLFFVLAAGAGAGSVGSARAEISARVPPGADHACVVPGGTRPAVAWAGLHNPVLSYPKAAVKDQALIWAHGRWHMVFSYVTNDTTIPGQEHWDIATAQSTDLRHWTAAARWSEQPGGMASPDVVRSPNGVFVATYDSPPNESGSTQAKLYYRTSSDLVHWSAPHPLAANLYPSPADRLIDPALAWNGNGIVLAYKVGTTSTPQSFEMAWSQSGSLDGPWVVLGRPDIHQYGDTFENYELVTVGGRWHLVATSNALDQPWLYTLSGDPMIPSSWLHWVDGREIQIPAEGWNTGSGISSVNYEHANSAFLCVDTIDGYAYLTYAGSQELSHFGGWGHAAIGVARSRDLVHWSVPPG